MMGLGGLSAIEQAPRLSSTATSSVAHHVWWIQRDAAEQQLSDTTTGKRNRNLSSSLRPFDVSLGFYGVT